MGDFGRRYSANRYFCMMGVMGCVHKLNSRMFHGTPLGEILFRILTITAAVEPRLIIRIGVEFIVQIWIVVGTDFGRHR